MSVRELVVLGTASQVPTRHRNHNGYMLLWDEEGLLFDPGEGTQRQMIRTGVTATQITRILITHFHGDHCLGLPSICQRISLDRVSHEIEIYFPASGISHWERLRQASIYRDRAELAARPVALDGIISDGPLLRITACRLDHPVETYGYRIQEPPGRTMLPEALEREGVRGPMVGDLLARGVLEVGGRTVRLDDVSVPRRGQSVAFIMDTRLCEAAFDLARGVDLLVCESTYLSEDEAEAREHSHLTARQAGVIAHEACAGRLVLTHFSQRYPSTEPFEREAREVHGDVIAVSDGDRVAVPPRRRQPKP